MQRKRISSLNMFIVAAATGLLATGAQAALDAPHNATNSIGCTSCHVMTSTLPKMLPPLDHTPVNIDDTLANNVCWSCHNDVDAVHRETHSSTLLGTGYGNWSVECWVCHNEHSQDQNRYNGSTYGKYIRRTIDLSKITGLVKTGKMPVVFTGPATFADGLSPYNGVCEVCHTQTTHFRNDGSGADNNHSGKGGTDCVSCHNHSTSFQGGADHSTFITDDNETGNAAKLCSSCHTGYAANPETAHSACAVCHTTAPTLLDSAFPTYNGQIDDDGTSMFANLTDAAVAPYTQYIYPNGGGRLEAPGGLVITSVGFPKVRCGECHKAKPNALQAGNHGGHSATDFPWDATTQTSCGTVGCHDYVANGNVVQNIHGNTCTVCHSNAAGGDGTAIVGSATNGVDGDATLGSTAAPHADNCLVCHPAATYDKSTVHHTSKNGYATAGNCTQCHAGTNYPGDHSTLVSLAANCADCHTGTQGTATGQPVNPANNKVHDACTTCHNTDNDGTLKAAYGKAQAMPNGGAGSNNGGGSCEACHTSGFSGYHATVSHSPMVSLYVNCATCHTGTEAPAGGPVPLDPLNNKKHDTCTVCHGADGRLIGSAAGKNGATNGGSDGGGNCSVCHGEYMYNHTSINHTATVALNVNCADCHTGTEGNATTVPLDPLNNKKHDACSVCHAANGALVGSALTHDGGTPGGTDGGGNCSTCHSTFYANHAASVNHAAMVSAYVNCSICHTATGNTVDPLDPKVHDACASCHGVDGRLTGSASTHDGATTGGSDGGGSCAVCHGEYFNNHSNINHTTTVAVGGICGDCHTATAGTATSVPTSLADNKVHDACATCHQATGILVTTPTANGWTIAMPDGGSGGGTNGGGTCLTCHGDNFTAKTHSAVHDAKFYYDTTGTGANVDILQANGSAGCASCHNDAGTALATFAAINTEHTAISCDKCHKESRDINETTASGTTVRQLIAARAAETTTDTNCRTCHVPNWANTPNHAGHSATDFGWAGNCQSCHGAGLAAEEVVAGIHGNTCDLCHTTGGPYNKTTEKLGANGDGDARLANGAADAAPKFNPAVYTCTTCHNQTLVLGFHGITIAQVTSSHQLSSNSTGGYDCEACHSTDAANEQLNRHMPVDTVANCALICHKNTTASVPTGKVAKTVIDTVTFLYAAPNKNDSKCEDCHAAKGDYRRHGLTDDAGADGAVDVHDQLSTSGITGVTDCANCHSMANVTARLQVHTRPVSGAVNNCLTCHVGQGDPANAQIASGIGGNAVNCNECHTDKGVYTLHGLTEATVADVHDKFAGETSTGEKDCGSCHLTTTAENRVHLHANCLYCHAPGNTTYVSPTPITSGTTAPTVVNNGRSTGVNTVQTCESCHGAKNNYAMHGLTGDNGVDGVADKHDQLFGSMGSYNDTSATASAIIPKYRSTGYTGSLPYATYGGKLEDSYNCLDCHDSGVNENYTTPPATASSSADVAKRLLLHSTDGTAANVKCSWCHDQVNSTDATWRDQVDTGREAGHHVGGGGATERWCENCHGVSGGYANGPSGRAMQQWNGSRHHEFVDGADADTTPEADEGNCTYCHADPRPASTADKILNGTETISGFVQAGAWATQHGTTGSNGGWYADDTTTNTDGDVYTVPVEMACQRCHETNANGAVINALDYNPINVESDRETTYLPAAWTNGTAPDVAKVTVKTAGVHSLAHTAKINIDNYGACLSCHSVQVFHAKPWWVKDGHADDNNNNDDTSASALDDPFDVLRYAPGRSQWSAWPANSDDTPDVWAGFDIFAINETTGASDSGNQCGTGADFNNNTGGLVKLRMYWRYTFNGTTYRRPYLNFTNSMDNYRNTIPQSARYNENELCTANTSANTNPWIAHYGFATDNTVACTGAFNGTTNNCFQRTTIPRINTINNFKGTHWNMTGNPMVPHYDLDLPPY